MIKIRPLIEVLGKIIKLPKDSYIDPSSLGSGTADETTVLKGDSTWGSIPSSVNIYNTNGTLTASRTVNLNNNDLTFTDGGAATSRFQVNIDDGTNAVVIDAANAFGVSLSASSSGGAGLLSVTTAGVNIGGFYNLPQTSGSIDQVLTRTSGGNTTWSTIIPTEFVFVSAKSDLPTPVAGVITLAANYTYFFTTTVDLTGDRLVCGVNTTILGGSSENCRIKSTGLVGTALITSVYSMPMRHITIEANVALNLDGDGTTTALDWFGVNFTDCTTIGTIKDYTNFIMGDSAFLNSGGLTFDGTIGSIGMSNCLFDCRSTKTAITLASTLSVSRRFRIIYSSFVILSGETGINVSTSATISDERYILDTVNFSGGGTYVTGVTHTSNKALFTSCVGITNTTTRGFYYMVNNTTDTTIGVPNVNVWVKAAGTTTASVNNSKFTNSNNRLTYTGAFSTSFLIVVNANVRSSAANQVISIGVAKNGTIQTETEMTIRTATANQEYPGSTQAQLELISNDYIELFVKNAGSTDIRVSDLNVSIIKISA